MRKIFLLVLSVIFVVSLTSCSAPEFEHPISVSYGLYENVKPVMLDYENDLMLELLNNGKWVNDMSNCGYDYEFEFGSHNVLRYHSDCGTFIDIENGRCLTISEKDRLAINESLERSLNN